MWVIGGRSKVHEHILMSRGWRPVLEVCGSSVRTTKSRGPRGQVRATRLGSSTWPYNGLPVLLARGWRRPLFLEVCEFSRGGVVSGSRRPHTAGCASATRFGIPRKAHGLKIAGRGYPLGSSGGVIAAGPRKATARAAAANALTSTPC